MELRQLRYFAAVAREANFTRAAARLRIAQPALSRQVKQLEEELGVVLLARDKRGTQLTPRGHAFLIEAEQILRQSDQALKRAQTNGADALNVAYVWGLFHSIVPPILQRFRAREPAFAVNLFDLPASEQSRGLSEGTIDVGFIGLEYEAHAARLPMRCVATTRFVLALPEGHTLARRKTINLAALAGEVFILISEEHFPGAAGVMREACKNAGFTPRTLEVERGHTILSLVAAGCGVALLPESLRALPHSNVVFRAVSQPISAQLFVAWRKGFEGAPCRSLLAAVEAMEKSDA